jgi:hypothetical protein
MIITFVAASITWQKGSFLVPESDLFLVDHNDPDRSFLSKVICPHVHDAHLFQGRELSHVLEFLDARFIDWCVSLGLPHFYSIITYTFLIALSFIHWRCARKYLQIDRLSCVLLLGLFWTSPCIFFSGQYLRNAKQGTALLLFLLIWYLIRKFQKRQGVELNSDNETASRRLTESAMSLPLLFLLAIGLCFMDRQGFFFVAIIAMTLLVLGICPLKRSYLFAAGGLVAAIICHTAYSRLLAPPLIESVNGFVVSFEYQKLPWDKFFMHPIGYLKQGTNLLINHFRYFFGNVGGEASSPVLFLWCGMLALFYQGTSASRSTVGAPVPCQPDRVKEWWILSAKPRWSALFLFWIAALIAMYALMVLRHFVLVWPDSRSHYYWIPSTMLILLAGTFTVHWTNACLGHSRLWVTNVVLAIALLANVKSLREHRRIQTTGHLEGYIAFAPHLLRELRSLPTAACAVPVRKFDTRKSVMIEEDLGPDGQRQTIENPRVNESLTPEDFVASSHYFNFVCSRRNVPFRQ